MKRWKQVVSVFFIVVLAFLAGCGSGAESEQKDEVTIVVETSTLNATPIIEVEEPVLPATLSAETGEAAEEESESPVVFGEDEGEPASDLSTPAETMTLEVPATGPADTADQRLTFELIPGWTVGEEITIELTKGRTDSNQGVVQLETVSRTPIEVLVIDRIDDGYVLQWTYGKTEIENAPAAADPSSEILLGLSEGMRVEYAVDLYGTPTDLRNWDEIQTVLGEGLEAMMEYMERQGMNQAELQQIREMIEPIFSSKEQIEALFTKEIQLYHHIFGWPPFETSTPMVYEDLLPNPFGGDPFPSVARFELVDYEPDADQVTVVWSQTLEPDSARRILMQSLTDMAAAMGGDPPTEDDLPLPFAIEDSSIYVIDVNSGWVVSAEYIREIIMGPSTRVDSTKIVAKVE